MKVALLRQASDPAGAVEKLAVELRLPVLEPSALDSRANPESLDYLLAFDDSRLTLSSLDEANPGELCIDFTDARLRYRAGSAIRGQNIAKAVGVKGEVRPSVLDATAGLGKDAYLLASLGCRVSMLERSPLVHALLADGLTRASAVEGETGAILSRMSLQSGDFLTLQPGVERFDVVYLDPMFPPRRKSAKVKKDMALLQQLLGHQEDGAELLEHARQIAKKRVVVKRGKLSAQLGPAKPDIEFKGSSSRYDVYLST